MFIIPEYLGWTSHKMESYSRTNPLANAKKVTGSWSSFAPRVAKSSGLVVKNAATTGWSVVGIDYKERLLLKMPEGYLPEGHEGVVPVELLQFGNIIQYGPLHEQALLFICEKDNYFLINEKELLVPEFEKLHLKDEGFSVTQLKDSDTGLILLKKTASTSQKFMYLGAISSIQDYRGGVRVLNEQGELVFLRESEKFIRDVQTHSDLENGYYMLYRIFSRDDYGSVTLSLAEFKAGYEDLHLNSMYSRELLQLAFTHVKGVQFCMNTPPSHKLSLPPDPSVPDQPEVVDIHSRYRSPAIQLRKVRKKFEVTLSGLSTKMLPYVEPTLDAAMARIFSIMELNNLALSGIYDKKLNKFHCGK